MNSKEREMYTVPTEVILKTRSTGFIKVSAPPKSVWKLLTHFEDFDFDPNIKDVEILTPDIRGVGMKTRWRFTDGEKERVQLEEIVEWNPPNYYTFKPHNAPTPRLVSFILQPISTGTLVILTKKFEQDEPNMEKIDNNTKRQLLELKKSAEEKK